MLNSAFAVENGHSRRWISRGPLARRRKTGRAFGVEGLESRCLLAAQAFGVFEGALPVSGSAAGVTIEVSKQDFTFNKWGRVVLELVATSANGVPLGIGRRVRPRAERTCESRPPAKAGGSRRWRPGSSRLRSPAAPPGGSYSVDFSLVGDVNGNGVVNRQDIRAIRSRLGVDREEPPLSPGADPFNNNRIGVADLRFARSDLHAGTTLLPLSLGLSASTRRPVQRARWRRRRPVRRRDASITLSERGAVQTGQADSQGKASFSAGLLTGQNTFDAVATDTFGQRVDATASVNARCAFQLSGGGVSTVCRPVDRHAAERLASAFQQLRHGQRQRGQPDQPGRDAVLEPRDL